MSWPDIIENLKQVFPLSGTVLEVETFQFYNKKQI